MTALSPDRPSFAADFRVGAWLVEPSLDRVSRDGHSQRLRPQLIDLLVVLARHAGHTVSKDVILAQVWKGQFVAESGLTRCIAEIRQALGDDANEPTLIQTIPKRGYRLVAPVMFLDATPSPAWQVPAADACVDPLAGPGAALDAPAGPAAELAPPAAAPPEASGLPAMAAPRVPPVPRVIRWTVAAAAAATLLVPLAWSAAGWSRAPVLTERDTVLLADVTNTTGDRAFDGPLRLALAVHLGQAPFLRFLPDDRVRATLARSGRPAGTAVAGPVALDLCRREGAAVVLGASIAPVGSHYAVGIEAVACGTGDVVGSELREVPRKEDVLSALGAAAEGLRRRLGESRASISRHDVPLVQATSSSLDALRAVTAGDDNRDHSKMEDALLDYRRATDLDPRFALAWARRGAAARNLGLTDESTLAFRRAYDLRERVSEPERFYIEAHYYRSVSDEPERAVETYRTWQRTYPGADVPPTNLASLAANVFGRYEEALPNAREAVRQSPYSSLTLRILVTALLGSGRVAEAKQALRDAAGRGIDDAVWHEYAFDLAVLEGDVAAQEAQVRWAASRPAAAIEITRSRALAAAGAGRLSESRRLWVEAAAAADRLLPPVRRARLRLWEAEAEALLGDPARARQAADAAVALHPQAATLLDAATAVALAGDHARARTFIAQATRLIEPGVSSRPVWLFVSQALVEAGAGRPAEALARIAEAARFERGREYAFSPLGTRARIAAAAGRPQEAVAAYRDLLALRPVLSVAPWAAYARLGLARALRDAGDTAGSVAAYDALLAGLAGADADAPLLLAGRRERAALAAGPEAQSSRSRGPR